jgi:hypothetical protein
MGIAILPRSAVKHSVASVVTCDIVGDLPMSEIALVSDKRVRTPVLDNFRAFTLESVLGLPYSRAPAWQAGSWLPLGLDRSRHGIDRKTC